MAAKFTINGRPPGARQQYLEEATAIARYARKVLIEKHGDQAPFIAQISDLVEGAVDRALRELATPLPEKAEPLASEGVRHYAMQARTAQEAAATPAANDGQPVPGGVVTKQDVGNAFLPGYVPPGDANHALEGVSVRGSKPLASEDEWLM